MAGATDLGGRLERADMKYGWPHKFYVEGIPNLLAGREVRVGGKWEGGAEVEPLMGQAPPFAHAKWYNEHLLDAGYDAEAFAALVGALDRRGGILFELDGGTLRWTRRTAGGG